MRAVLEPEAIVELSDDPAMSSRVQRQAAVSIVALGAITALAWSETDAHPAVVALLAAGWALMPTVLLLSVARPRLRLALTIPATAVSVALLVLCATALPAESPSRLGWLLVTAGVLAGGGLGGWFWYRLAPVPPALDNPMSAERWALIGGHVGLVVAGLALLALGSVG